MRYKDNMLMRLIKSEHVYRQEIKSKESQTILLELTSLVEVTKLSSKFISIAFVFIGKSISHEGNLANPQLILTETASDAKPLGNLINE